ENVEIRNNGDALVNSTQKTLDELKDKFSDEDKEAIQDALKDLRSAISGDDVDKIKEKTDALTQVLQKASTAIYQKAAQQHQQTQGDHQSSSEEEGWSGHPDDDDKTINADYKVKKDEDKKDKKK
ncbi:MAG: Hsp70 family protein, partial [Candidatus Thermoplasmatota archaeon]|nr:Hsp70 family protein [Candidatus Thermoplasmatota archaeon]